MLTIEHNTIKTYFGTLPDPRINRQKRHKLIDIITITLCAVLSGAETWTDIAEFGKTKKEWFSDFLELANGIPSHDTFGRVFSKLDTETFHQSFIAWIQAGNHVVEGQVIAIDGKCLRHSYDKSAGKSAIYMVSAWASENKIVLGQVKTEEKSNEITAIPKLLDALEIKNSTVTIDAAGCQRKIASKIIEKGGDYTLAVKGNQGHLRDYIEDLFTTAMKNDFQDVAYDYYESTDAGHGRVEVRRHWTVSELSGFSRKSDWKGLTSIGRVESERHINDKITTERRYYINSQNDGAEPFSNRVRAHWGVENELHWCLDVGFREDECRVRKGHASENLAVIRHIALNLLKKNKSCKGGIKAKRLKAGWDDTYRELILSSV